MTKKQKGFTLIELLVVIAIIGILAGILFVAIDPKKQTDKATDAKTKSALASIRTQAALIFSEAGNYDSVCNPGTNIEKLVESANPAGTAFNNAVCSDTVNSWAALGKLFDGKNARADNWCVDSSGFTGKGTIKTKSNSSGGKTYYCG